MATQQTFYCTNGGINSTVTVYAPPITGGLSAGWLGTPYLQIWPRAGTLKNLRVNLATAPGASQSRTFTLIKNGVDTAVAVTISDSETSKSTILTTTITDSDTLSFRATATGAAGNAGTVFWTIEFVADTGTGIAVHGCTAAPSTGSNSHTSLLGGKDWVTTQINVNTGLVSAAGSVIRIRYSVTVAPGSGKSWLMTVYKNAVAQDGTSGTPDTRVTIADSATSGVMTTSVTASAGDRLQIRIVPSGTPAAATLSFGAVYQATVDGEFNIAAYTGSFLAAGYMTICPRATGWGATESDFYLYGGVSRTRISDFRFMADATVTNGTFTVRRSAADTTVTISAVGVTSGSDTTHNFNLLVGETIDYVFAGTPGLNRTVILSLKGFNRSTGGGAGAGKGDRGNRNGGGILVLTPGAPLLICYNPNVDGSTG